MKRPTIYIRLSVFVGVVVFCAGVVFAQQPISAQPAQPAPSAAFQPAPAPLPLQQPVQAQSAPPAATVFQPAPAPLPQPIPAQPVALPPVQGQAATSVEPVPAQPQQQPGVQLVRSGSAGVSSTGVIDAVSSMRNGVELSAEALAAAPYLFYDRGRAPGVGRVMYPGGNGFYQRYDKVMVEPTWKKEPPFKVGDTVDVLRPLDRVKIGGQRTRLVARVARGAVLGFAGKRVVLRLDDVWDMVVGSERIAKAVPFVPFYVDNKPVGNGREDIKARVVARVDNTISPYMHQYIVVSKGSEAGIKLGDFFKVFDRELPKRLAEALVEAQAVNVTDKASTLVIQKVYGDRLALRDEAYLSFRAAAK